MLLVVLEIHVQYCSPYTVPIVQSTHPSKLEFNVCNKPKVLKILEHLTIAQTTNYWQQKSPYLKDTVSFEIVHLTMSISKTTF